VRSQVKRILLISIVLIGAGALVFGLSFYFLYVNGVKALSQRLEEKQAVLQELLQKEKEIPILEKAVTVARIEAIKAKNQIPERTEREFDNFVRHIYAIAKQTLVEVQAPKAVTGAQARAPGKAAIPPGIHQATYELTLLGDFKRLWDFLGVLEKSARFVEFESFAFVPSKTPGADPKTAPKEEAKLTIKLNAYATDEKKQAIPPPAPRIKPTAEPAAGKTTPPPK